MNQYVPKNLFILIASDVFSKILSKDIEEIFTEFGFFYSLQLVKICNNDSNDILGKFIVSWIAHNESVVLAEQLKRSIEEIFLLLVNRFEYIFNNHKCNVFIGLYLSTVDVEMVENDFSDHWIIYFFLVIFEKVVEFFFVVCIYYIVQIS